MRPARLILPAVSTVAVLLAAAPGVRAQSDGCLTPEPPAASVAPHPLRFGITPQLAGTVGESQGDVVAEDSRARDTALAQLRPPRRTLVVRLNRLFMSEGDAAIARFARRAARYQRKGFEVESQIRYYPAPEQEGDMRSWRRFVRRATRALARNQALVALSITNEVNLPISENTSDGAYDEAIEAIVSGIPTAARVLRRAGRGDVDLGFTYAYRYLPMSDTRFWRSIPERAGPRFARSIDYVGIQLYPGPFWPPVLLTETAGEATLEALTLVRDCYMPLAALGEEIELWISEIGYATNQGHTETRQASELTETTEAVHALSGELGITDLRYFNLRDNRDAGTDLFDNVGLLRSDYTPKPAFDVYRSLISRFGTR